MNFKLLIMSMFFVASLPVSAIQDCAAQTEESAETIQPQKEFKSEFGFTPAVREGLEKPTLPEKAKEGLTKAAKIYSVAGCIFALGILGYCTFSKHPSITTIKSWSWAALQSASLETVETVAATVVL